MDISNIITNILIKEQETQNVKGVDYSNTRQVLELGIQNCPTFKNFIPEKYRTIKELDADNVKYFPKLNPPAGPIYYVSAPYQDDNVRGKLVLFGILYNEAAGTEGRTFKAYVVGTDGTTKIVAKGWGKDCNYFKETSQLGQTPLSDEQKARLETYLGKNGDAFYLFKPDSDEYEPQPLKGLKGKNGQLILPDYNGDGYIWIQKDISNKFTKGVVSQVEPLLIAQGFTTDFPGLDTDEGNMGFLFKDISGDLPQLAQIKGMSPTTIIWPSKGTLKEPDRETCRTAIKTLSDCSKSQTGIGCTKDLFKNKLTALNCGDKNFVGGAIGLKDEYNSLLTDGGRFGLLRLVNARREGLDRTPPNSVVRESIQNTVISVLTEEIRKKNR